jgi:branched-chain amino acid transport system substrate-binding protein
MKMEALTSHMAPNKDIKSVYIIGQNYAFGQAVSRAAKEYLKRKRPDIRIAGDDLHPIAQVKDFSPYIAKIKASGADTVITGNWGADLALLIRAARDADLKANFYTYYGVTTGVPTAMGAAGAERVKIVGNWLINTDGFGQGDRRRLQEEVQRRLLHCADAQQHRHAVAGDPRPGRPIRSRWRSRWKGRSSAA